MTFASSRNLIDSHESPHSYFSTRPPTQSSSETASNGLLTTIERAAHSDDESAPPSLLNPTAAMDRADGKSQVG